MSAELKMSVFTQKNGEVTAKGSYRDNYPYNVRNMFLEICGLKEPTVTAERLEYLSNDFSVTYKLVGGYNPISEFSGIALDETGILEMIQEKEDVSRYSFFFCGNEVHLNEILTLLKVS